MSPVETLRDAWAALTVVGLAGTGWHLWVAARAQRLYRWGQARALTGDDWEAICGRRRNALYRLTAKVCFTAFAGVCWALFTGLAPGWSAVWVATALFGAGLLVLTTWSVHAWRAVRRRYD